jgi:hypothetical protein
MNLRDSVQTAIYIDNLVNTSMSQIEHFALLMRNGNILQADTLFSQIEDSLLQDEEDFEGRDFEYKINFLLGCLYFERGIRTLRETHNTSTMDLVEASEGLNQVMSFLDENAHFSEQEEYNETWFYVRAGLMHAQATLALGNPLHKYNEQEAGTMATHTYLRILDKPSNCEDVIFSCLGGISEMDKLGPTVRKIFTNLLFQDDPELIKLASSFLEADRVKREGPDTIEQLLYSSPHLIRPETVKNRYECADPLLN